MVIRQILWASVLSFVLRSRHRQRHLLFRWIDRIAKLARLLPVSIACKEVRRVFRVIPAQAAAYPVFPGGLRP
ncbi:MAG: hypothetical protein RMM08_02175 [Armatimonadota bacterium]|nr:hypothetical protein [bacterium]MDW8320146.1 hypothetical protein [Armatimonadota bacterium]